ncbi:hypothetical protein ACQPXM_24010 [Kribbella sp. CA-253562]|uniref:hypothetical protein n=1 Tax=Kribbella sp. CA-253562 TaxID=3239942 RepID=UPI003D8BD9E8
MRDHNTSTVRQLIVALLIVEDELRAARRSADLEQLTALIRRKQVTLRELRRLRHRSSAA